MFRFLFLLLCFTYSIPLFGQSHSLTVLNGYGSGVYAAGETVDIWSSAFYDRAYFDRWTGDTLTIQDPLDWHTRLVMPDHDVTVEAVMGQLPPEATYVSTEIQGADTLKKVWAGFPGTMPLNGLVWLFHGTNGSGENWFLNNDMLLCVNKLLSAGYAVVSLDCEEKTLGQDLNGDQVYRWDYTFDSIQNTDLRNVKAIRDTLITRGWIDAGIDHIGYGYSAGGAFATHIATQLGWRAGLSHNSAGVPWVPEFGLTPILYSMTEHDDHPEVGPAAAIQAEANTAELRSRGICSTYRLALAQPLYPERFNRDESISLALSEAIFTELQDNLVLDDAHYLLYKSEQLIPVIALDPDQWPVMMSLTPQQRVFVADEIDETYATHRFNSDLFGSDFRFMETLCEGTANTKDVAHVSLPLYPNPAKDIIYLPNERAPYTVWTSGGQVFWKGTTDKLDIRHWPAGVYMVVCGKKTGRFIKLD